MKNKNVKIKIWLILMKLGSIFGCHQLPERSFFFHGYQFPVCMRCTGILIGEMLALSLYKYLRITWWQALILVLPLAVDGSGQYAGYWKSSKYSRVITGIFAGFGCMELQVCIIRKIINMVGRIL